MAINPNLSICTNLMVQASAYLCGVIMLGYRQPAKNKIVMQKDYYKILMEDVRFREGLSSCMSCGVCTSVCPAAEHYKYDPREIVTTVFEGDNQKIEELLCSETIWYCGECMSCRPRCPRGNTPGYVIQALRTLSQRAGFFARSEKGRQQLALKRVIGENILNTGYCIFPRAIAPELHPEQGPVWRWIYDNDKEVFARLGKNYQQSGAGAVRKLEDGVMDELRNIFRVTGGSDMFQKIEQYSLDAAKELGFEDTSKDYIDYIYTTNNGTHNDY